MLVWKCVVELFGFWKRWKVFYYPTIVDSQKCIISGGTVVAEFPCQTIEDSVTSATYIKSYSVDVDFTNIDTAVFCIVRTGKSEVQLQVTDESGNTVQDYATIYEIPKRWYI